MASLVIRIDTRRITSGESFHDVFAENFGFPDFYGRNMNAWIDCMSSLDCPEDGMTKVHAPPGGVVVIELDHITDFAQQHRDLYDMLIECAAFVNHRRIDVGEEPVLAISFQK